VQIGLTGFIANVWNSLSGAVGAVGKTITSSITSLGASVSGALGSLWTNLVGFVSRVADGIHQGVNAVGSAVGSAVNTIGNWVSEALKGVATALGTALSNFVGGIGQTLQNVGGAIVGFLSEDIVTPLLGALSWIRDAIYNILRSLWSSIEGFFGGHSPVTPEEAAGFTVPLLLIGAGAGFGVSVMGAVGSLKVVGSGVEARAISDFMESAFAIDHISSSIITPIFRAAYQQPIQYYYNAMFRPLIPDTRTATEMLWHRNISEAEWRQIYAYHGWKDADIDAWSKTFWTHPSQRMLLGLLGDPDIPEAWIRQKLSEIGFEPEDVDELIAYGKRQTTKDERAALAAADLNDFVDGIIDEATFRADLAALKFTREEIEYRVAKAYMSMDRNARKAALAAAKAAKPKPKFLTESDLERELELGLITPEQFVADMQRLDFPEDVAKRKLRLLFTPQPLSPAEIERRRRLVEARIARTRRRYDFVIARHDLQTGFLADTIEYLSSLEKPPATRIATLQAQLAKAADEKALIIAERDAEIAELEEELKLVQAA